MENSIKIICNNATYVGKSSLNTDLSKSNSLLVGSTNNKTSSYNQYISILNFHMPSLQTHFIKKANLFLFVEDIMPVNKSPWSLGVLGNSENIHVTTVDWLKLPKKNYTKLLIKTINYNTTGSYLKIDVTPIIKSLATYNMYYNIILVSQKSNSNTILKLSSIKTDYPPYLEIATNSSNKGDFAEGLEIETYISEYIENNTDEIANKSNEDTNTIQEFSSKAKDELITQEKIILNNELFNKIINLLSDEDLKLSSQNDTLNKRIDSLFDKLDNIDSRIKALDEKLAELSSNQGLLKKVLNSITIEPMN